MEQDNQQPKSQPAGSGRPPRPPGSTVVGAGSDDGDSSGPGRKEPVRINLQPKATMAPTVKLPTFPADKKWQAGLVQVQARLVPRFLWSTASIDVFLDGQCILRTGGQLKFTGSQSATFTYSGSTHTAELSWGTAFLLGFPYQLQIDGTSVSEARVYIKNWPLGLIVAILIPAILVVAFYYLFRTP
jgi:hypothetical protein